MGCTMLQVQVEMQQSVEQAILTLKGINDEAEDGAEESDERRSTGLRLNRIYGLEIDPISGFHIQRCGGGRRIIKKHHGVY